jgi:hypothetical protein
LKPGNIFQACRRWCVYAPHFGVSGRNYLTVAKSHRGTSDRPVEVLVNVAFGDRFQQNVDRKVMDYSCVAFGMQRVLTAEFGLISILAMCPMQSESLPD